MNYLLFCVSFLSADWCLCDTHSSQQFCEITHSTRTFSRIQFIEFFAKFFFFFRIVVVVVVVVVEVAVIECVRVCFAKYVLLTGRALIRYTIDFAYNAENIKLYLISCCDSFAQYSCSAITPSHTSLPCVVLHMHMCFLFRLTWNKFHSYSFVFMRDFCRSNFDCVVSVFFLLYIYSYTFVLYSTSSI